MPPHSTPRLTITIRSSDKKLTFYDAKVVLPYMSDLDVGKEVPYVKSVQRLGAGDGVDNEVWRVEEVRDPHITECVPGLRLFQLLFKGEKYTKRLDDKCSDDRAKVVNLYRSLLSEDRIRLTLSLARKESSGPAKKEGSGLGKKENSEGAKPPPLVALEVDLRYQLEKR